MLRRLAIAAVVLLLLVGALGLGGYFWARANLWSKIETLAAENGVRLQKPGIELRWLGGFRFFLRLKDLKGELQSPAPVTGPFELPLVEADIELINQRTRARIYSVKALDLTAQLRMLATSEPEAKPNAEIEIPKIEIPSIERPGLPIEIQIDQLQVTARQIDIVLEDAMGDTRATATNLDLKGSALLEPQHTDVQFSLDVGPTEILQRSNTGTAEARITSVSAKINSTSPPESPLLLRPQGEVQFRWSSLNYQKFPIETKTPTVSKKSTGADPAMSLSDQGGNFKLSIDGQNIKLKVEGRKLQSSSLQKSSDWGIEISPVTARKYALKINIPELLRLDSKLTIPPSLDFTKPEGQLSGELKLNSEIAELFLEENPLRLKTQIAGPFSIRLTSAGDLFLKTELRGPDVVVQIDSELNQKSQEAKANGFLSLRFGKSPLRFAGYQPQGRVSSPFKLLLRQQKKFFFESELRFDDFSVTAKDLKLVGMNGTLSIRQAWAFLNGRWQLSPRLSPNAFGRADFDSFQPLEARSHQIRIAKLMFHQKTYGPIVMDLKFEQNLLRSGAWIAGVGEATAGTNQGLIEGALQTDLSIENPKVGLLMRAFGVKLEDLLPETMLRSSQRSAQGLSFRLGMDWDVGKATAVGRLDWTEINAAQVLQILDFLDPQFENATFNQARMILSQAFPTRVQVEMRGSVADIRIATNLLNLPEVRNVAISPYLSKANEALYASELYRSLKSPPSPTKEP